MELSYRICKLQTTIPDDPGSVHRSDVNSIESHQRYVNFKNEKNCSQFEVTFEV